jgi:DNA (cytosine-5)-methyltransferase 1
MPPPPPKRKESKEDRAHRRRRHDGPLPSLDLFSGVAGITLALAGVAEPVAYCDVAPEPQANLGVNMANGSIPRAPISTDVAKLDRKWLAKEAGARAQPKMVVAGFPCVGFSSSGLRQAFENEQSSLFSHVLRIVDEFDLPVVFLENVSNILKLGMGTVAHELAVRRGFEVRWCVVGADDVGAPQQRRRWFCLAVKPGFVFSVAKGLRYKPFPWGEGYDPKARMRCSDDRAEREEGLARAGLLGNSVVPDAVRTAFFYLATGFDPAARPDAPGLAYAPSSPTLTREVRCIAASPREQRALGTWPSCGAASPKGAVYSVPGVQARCAYVVEARGRRAGSKIVLVPGAFKTAKKPSPMLSTELVRAAVSKEKWATPRHSLVAACNYLTARSKNDLPTQVRFERRTPARVRACDLDPRFVEWLMGYRAVWTKLRA